MTCWWCLSPSMDRWSHEGEDRKDMEAPWSLVSQVGHLQGPSCRCMVRPDARKHWYSSGWSNKSCMRMCCWAVVALLVRSVHRMRRPRMMKVFCVIHCRAAGGWRSARWCRAHCLASCMAVCSCPLPGWILMSCRRQGGSDNLEMVRSICLVSLCRASRASVGTKRRHTMK